MIKEISIVVPMIEITRLKTLTNSLSILIINQVLDDMSAGNNYTVRKTFSSFF